MPFLLMLLSSRKNTEGDSLGFLCYWSLCPQAVARGQDGWLPLTLFKFTKGTDFQILFMSDVSL